MKLKKVLNLIDVFSIAAGGMISAGLFVLPGLAYAKAGPAVVAAYLLAGLLALAGMLSQAELASAMPKSGGAYFYVTRSMGSAVGTVYGIITWAALCLKSAFALMGIGAFTALLWPEMDVRLILLPLAMVFVVVNLLGIDLAGKVQLALVLGILLTLLVYIVRGVPQIAVSRFEPFAPTGFAGLFSTCGFVFICYGGLLKAASVAEEVKEPGRTIPQGMILATVVVSLFYLFVISVTVGVLDGQGLRESLTPISDAAAVFMGRGGRIVLSVAAVLAFISAANGGIMAASRYPMALSRDEMLPQFLGRINPRFRTPTASVLVTGAFVIMALFLDLKVLVKAASAVLILTYVFTCFSIIILRESRLQNYRPEFRAPLYPWIQVVGVIGMIALLFGIGREAFQASLFLIAGGLFVFWYYGRIRDTREFALLHLIERITAKELTTRSLESELKEIVRERDEILKDRFDHVIEQAHVLDIAGKISMESFFQLAAEQMARKLEVQPDRLYELFLARERESTTALTPFLAIPHIVVEGQHHFDVLVARCREGIYFSETAPQVHTVLVLVGTRDERPFHLRTLAAIAQIVQDGDFERKWMAAKDTEALRDILLLGKRRRHV